MIITIKAIILTVILLLGMGVIAVISVALSEMVDALILPKFGITTTPNEVSSFGRAVCVVSFILLIIMMFYPFLSLILYVKRW